MTGIIMNSEKKYPYIAQHPLSDKLLLITGKGKGVKMEDDHEEIEISTSAEFNSKNIAHEHLSNTWGVVESKEHAEFIIELAELHGFEQRAGLEKAYPCYFCFDKDEIYFFSQKHNASNDGEKQITIPLPPEAKAPPELTPEEEFELHQNQAVQALNSTEPDAKTWPKLGDRVTTYGQQGDVILPADRNGFYIIDADGLYLAAKAKDITKPKSKEDLLIEELQTKLCENNYVDNYTLANDIVNGMIEGLVYEPK